jgi:DNA helicase-2/ATP-dependent DNA helicase PcrA
MEEDRVSGLNFVTSQSTRFVSEAKTRRYYFTKDLRIHSDKASKFSCKVIERSDEAPIRRLERIYDCLFFDECQDLAGYDLDLVEYLLQSEIELQLVGDYRQTTFLTHPPRRNRKYIGPKQLDKFKEWETSGLCTIDHHDYSYRCVQEICDFADKFHPDAPDTVSRNKTATEHDGVFAVRRGDLQNYYEEYRPQPLRYDKRTKCEFGSPLNFGASKGMTFERTLIYPHRKLHAYLCSGNLADAGNALEKIYVAITRARQSVAFVIDDDAEVTGLPVVNV